MLVYRLIICVFIQCVDGFWDDRDYHDNFDDDPDELPDDWETRIDPAVMKAHWTNLSIRGSLEDDIMFADAGAGIGPQGTAGRQTVSLWPNGKVPYRISDLFGKAKKRSQDVFVIQQAIAAIESKTFRCVTFTEKGKESNYINFQPGENCSSYVGIQGGMQPVFLDPARCMQLGIVQHEILHAVGLFHEHSRSDRNASVIIYEDEIMDSHKSQYGIIPNMPTFGTDYDLESLMHYGPYDFAKTAFRPVMIPRKDGVYRMGQREGLSVRDAAKLRTAYQCQVDQGDEKNDQDSEERPFPGFSGLPMEAEQCALQFNDHCRSVTSTVDNCTGDSLLLLYCDESADNSFLRATTTAMAKPPLRPIFLVLTDSQITTEALYPVEKLVKHLQMGHCRASDSTSKLPSFSFISLQELIIFRCADIRIKKSDFKSLPSLRVIVFQLTTILYLEEGTFTNLPKLRIISWHEDLLRNFGTDQDRMLYNNEKFDGNLVHSMLEYLKRIHCDCEFAWLRRWLDQSGILQPVPESSVIFDSASRYISGSEFNRIDIFIPIDCAMQPFPSDFSMINFAQNEFSVNEPRCPTRSVNATYESLKFKRVYSLSPIDLRQCRLQFGKTCKPWEKRSPLQATELAVLDYCLNLFTSSQPFLNIQCLGNATVRDVQEIAFALAKPPLRVVNLNLDDGNYITYRAFSPIRTQILNMTIYDCVGKRATSKLASLYFENLLYLAVANCHNIMVQVEDFATTPNIRIILFAHSTVVGVTQFTFSSLPNLEILSLEYEAQEVPTDDSAYYRYLLRLHCDCEYSSFRAWLQQRIIDQIPTVSSNVSIDTYRNERMIYRADLPNVWTTILEFEVEGGTGVKRWYWGKAELYQRFDCAIGKINDDQLLLLLAENSSQFNYSLNAPSCENASSSANLPVITSLQKSYPSESGTMDSKSSTSKKDWTASLNRVILQERRSELTAKAVDGGGSAFHYDDQALSSSSVAESGYLTASRYWPNNGKNVPYEISEAFDVPDVEEIKDALHTISAYTSQCVTFKLKEREDDYIFFQLGQRCQSSVGRQGGQQNITLSQACIFRGAIQHLVLHAMGLFHEHHRADRDDYLRIYFNRTNVQPDSFLLRKLPQMQTYGTEYDLESIMHYGAFDLTDSQQSDLPVFLPKKTARKGKPSKIGQRRTLSAKDIVKLYTAYNCTMQPQHRGAYEPLPSFVKELLSLQTCNTLSRLRCASSNIVNCTSRGRAIDLLCGPSTTIDDWNQTAATVAKLPLHVVILQIVVNRYIHDAPDAFRPIRRQIIFATFFHCQNCRFTSLLPVFGFINVMHLRLMMCYGLIIRKKDFYGFPRLQILVFAAGTILNLENGTFSSLLDLKVLSLEHNLFSPVSSAFNVSLSQQIDYLRRLHCGCDFADFRMWRRKNKALRTELEEGELTFVVGVAGNGRIKKNYVFYPVDCFASLPHTTDIKFNFSQLEYSINEPLCEPGSTATIMAYDKEQCKAGFVNQSPEPGGRFPVISVGNAVRVTSLSTPRTDKLVLPHPDNETADAVPGSTTSYTWIYGCLGGAAGLCVILAAILVWRRTGCPHHRSGNVTTLESGPLLAGSVAIVARPSLQISTASTELTHPYLGDVGEVSSDDVLPTEGTELLPLNSSVVEANT
ncbi:uncharacterized protein LOC129592973 isoform X2 [Paramacrobiotus metropolitanus]|uniref:uncharacterized protein LOC129592973 isoform X2 n=1 Tax=Paramacrobiotus metropolitanus TaxID=2943436 RepID=UPI0024458D79|nr:uncharacterized protein LOC129592973 isoform X2 [Paramacrobiotus metropolitanus]